MWLTNLQTALEMLAMRKKNLCLQSRFFQSPGKKESGQIMYVQETGVKLNWLGKGD